MGKIKKHKKDRILLLLQKIADETQKDVSRLDGQPFDGKTVAAELGKTYAAIVALTAALKAIVKEL